MAKAVAKGYEGLILRQDKRWLKVKPIDTFDVEILSLIEGKGKYKGKLGALVTSLGNVGTGFTDEEREDIWENKYIGNTVEVSYMHLTEDGKFRHPRFLRIRFDK